MRVLLADVYLEFLVCLCDCGAVPGVLDVLVYEDLESPVLEDQIYHLLDLLDDVYLVSLAYLCDCGLVREVLDDQVCEYRGFQDLELMIPQVDVYLEHQYGYVEGQAIPDDLVGGEFQSREG